MWLRDVDASSAKSSIRSAVMEASYGENSLHDNIQRQTIAICLGLVEIIEALDVINKNLKDMGEHIAKGS